MFFRASTLEWLESANLTAEDLKSTSQVGQVFSSRGSTVHSQGNIHFTLTICVSSHIFIAGLLSQGKIKRSKRAK